MLTAQLVFAKHAFGWEPGLSHTFLIWKYPLGDNTLVITHYSISVINTITCINGLFLSFHRQLAEERKEALLLEGKHQQDNFGAPGFVPLKGLGRRL